MKKKKSILNDPEVKKDINAFVESGGKIHLRPNSILCRRWCCITGRTFRPGVPFAFFAGKGYFDVVEPEVALEIGFTMDYKDWKELSGLAEYAWYREYEEAMPSEEKITKGLPF